MKLLNDSLSLWLHLNAISPGGEVAEILGGSETSWNDDGYSLLGSQVLEQEKHNLSPEI